MCLIFHSIGDMPYDFLKLVKKKCMKPKDDLLVELLGIQNVCIYKILLLILVPWKSASQTYQNAKNDSVFQDVYIDTSRSHDIYLIFSSHGFYPLGEIQFLIQFVSVRTCI